MAGRSDELRNRKGGCKVGAKISLEPLDYHEGLSLNQVKIILREFNLDHKYDEFTGWMSGQTGPVIERPDRHNRRSQLCGVYEYDLFRWIANKKTGSPLIWD